MKPVERRTRPLALVLWTSAVVALLAIGLMAPARAEGTPAPDFSLTDIDGNPLNLTMFRGKILILDFMYVNCASCEIARPVLEEVYAAHPDVMAGLSIDILPSDTDAALRQYRDDRGIPWSLARDTDGMQIKYGVTEVVWIFLVDQDGFLIYSKRGMSPGEEPALRAELEATVQAALRGEAPGIELQQVSIFALAALAGVGSFFSPCSFPMLPGYMAFFLGIDTKNPGQMTKGRAVFSGVLSSLGIILVYGLIGVALLAIGTAAAAVVPALQPIVGALLILMGIVMFTSMQFYWLVNPFRSLRARLFPNWTPQSVRGTYGKLFSYGVGYGAAGFGCVAPPFIAAVLNATTLGGLGGGLAVLAVYASIVVALMVAITLVLAVAGKTAVHRMNRYTDVIKKVSAAVLIVAGAYLVYFWYAAWVAP